MHGVPIKDIDSENSCHMEGAKEMARAVEQFTIMKVKRDKAKLAYDIDKSIITSHEQYDVDSAYLDAQNEVLDIAEQWQPPPNNSTAAKHMVLKKIEQLTAEYHLASHVTDARLEQQRIAGIHRYVADYTCGFISDKLNDLQHDLACAVKREFEAYQHQMPASTANARTSATGAKKSTRNVRACQGKGVQQ